jgi:hypothetical protein
MNPTLNIYAAARHALCFVLATLIVSAALVLGTVGANAELNSARQAQVTVEVA